MPLPIPGPTPAPDPDEDERLLQRSAAELVPLLHADLHRLARRLRRRSAAGATLQTTALVHEVFLKLQGRPAWNDPSHFLRAAALAMRQVLVDEVRARLALRRGAGAEHLTLSAAESVCAADDADERVLRIDAALQGLGALSPRLRRTVECRYFAGYTEAETADALGVSVATVQRDWAKARAWLHREIADPA
ncbi:ECF-type sigma factor [Piscinibacter sakaiensis]|uniref:RNA polymerase sigma-70 ECF-like HTH domain-containing protein n=1 Tax=Piscinibacter sakaiensis TaxID=1547922 RepID=A0A0K8NVU8_PISS1|nr:ECF-type sigma factor [Piscinibacter sakaiensis]GAP34511.1 hypothetical protein ISF6_4686 [Piscinibacter sakaiensis]